MVCAGAARRWWYESGDAEPGLQHIGSKCALKYAVNATLASRLLQCHIVHWEMHGESIHHHATTCAMKCMPEPSASRVKACLKRIGQLALGRWQPGIGAATAISNNIAA